ncbi:hypothetical protein L2089_16770 [Paenibacillus hunanensis]|uniref:hypothetical protein n=1 Tax=Paenibacillus hunanensis TaxID=539262 RepID=UPI0020270272|nr:hypothetical protein [Paenibacillus hunanensis]MCL9662340.1 hypothetical protein [Paenibacillus hunanensis]
MSVSFQKMAEQALEHRIGFDNNEEEIQLLAKQMELLNQYGMNKVSEVLLQNAQGSKRKVSDFIAEHNFAADLIRYNPDGIYQYEPPEYNRPPDFVLPRDNKTFYLQMKRLNMDSFDNRRYKILQNIREQLSLVPIGKFILIDFAENFGSQDVVPLIDLIKLVVQKSDNIVEYSYPNELEPKAIFSFSAPNNKILTHLKLGSTSDMNFRDITGDAEEQIRSSLNKAIGAFTWNNDVQNINLIVMESDLYDDIDISQAVFGEELYIMGRTGSLLNRLRDTNGFFNQNQYRNKLCGVIALRRTNPHAYICGYKKTLFINPNFEDYLYDINKEIEINYVIRATDYP